MEQGTVAWEPGEAVGKGRSQEEQFIWDNTKPLSRVVYERRVDLGLTQQDVANALELRSAEFIGMVEKEHRAMHLNRIPRLAEVLGLDQRALCRLALFEQAPECALVCFGSQPQAFLPKPGKRVRLRSYEKERVARLLSLPENLRAYIFGLVDQLSVLEPGRVRKAGGA